MTQRHNSSFGAAVCTEVDPRRCSLVRTSIPNNPDMLVYRHASNSEKYRLPSLDTSAPVVQPFTCGADFNDAYYSGESILSADTSQYAYYPRHEYYSNFSDMQPQSRSSLWENPFTGNIEPYLPYPQGAYSSHPHTYYTASTCSMAMKPGVAATAAATAVSPDVMSFRSVHDQYYTPPSWQQNLPVFFPPEYDQATSTDDGIDGTDGIDDFEEDECSNFDKPYAQLIYEALMQAPGHRMLLRDIYDWFITNTGKPRESGTNGWQNSIRHNLSMNQVVYSYCWMRNGITNERQAFENDKNDPTISRGTKKANSMWVLTDHAIKHGVQSTTRYRKNGNSKKGPSNRAPAIQRQRSGARGGRAARRAARVKRQDHQTQKSHNHHYNGFDSPSSYGHTPSPLSTSRDQWSVQDDSPITPSEESFPHTSYSLPHRSYCHYDPNDGFKAEAIYEEEHIRQLLSVTDQTFGKLERRENQDQIEQPGCS